MIPSRGNVHSSRLAERRRRIFLIKLWLLVFLCAGVAGGAAYLLRDERITIARVHAEGNSAVATEDIQRIVREEIQGSYLYLVPKKNIFFYPRERIESAVALAYPRFESVSVSRRDLESIEVRVEEKHPFALWCGPAYSPEDAGGCYFADKDGFVFAKAPDFSGFVFTRYFGGAVSGAPIGKVILPKEEFRSFQFFLDTLKREGFAVSAVVFSDHGVVEGYFDNGGKIIFNLSQDLSRAIDNLKLLVESSNFAGRDAKGKFSVDYVDLQSSNKIFYKPRSAKITPPKPAATAVATSTSTSTASQ